MKGYIILFHVVLLIIHTLGVAYLLQKLNNDELKHIIEYFMLVFSVVNLIGLTISWTLLASNEIREDIKNSKLKNNENG